MLTCILFIAHAVHQYFKQKKYSYYLIHPFQMETLMTFSHFPPPDSSKCFENSTMRYCPHRLRNRGFGWFLSLLPGKECQETKTRTFQLKKVTITSGAPNPKTLRQKIAAGICSTKKSCRSCECAKLIKGGL